MKIYTTKAATSTTIYTTKGAKITKRSDLLPGVVNSLRDLRVLRGVLELHHEGREDHEGFSIKLF